MTNLDAHRDLTSGGANAQTQTVSDPERRPVRRLFAARWILVGGAVAFAAAIVLGLNSFAVAAIVVAGMVAGSFVPADNPKPLPASPVAEPRLDRAAPELGAFLAALPSPVVILDRQLAVVDFNPPAVELLPNLRKGDPIAFALRNPDVIDAARAIAERGGSRRVDYSERVPLERAIEVQISAVSGSAPGSGSVLIVLRDATQQYRIEQMRADFVANASHELRTPLASVLGFIETLQGPAKNDAPARDRFLEIMRAQANRMSRLIDDLLSLSRIELNAHVQPQTRVELGSIVSHIVDTLAPLAQERGVEIAVQRKNASLEVLGDRDELIRVFENLVENAVKYGASGGRVEITLSEAARGAGRTGEIVVQVRDFGPGISAEHLPRLTERFYRVDVTQSRDKGGTGLGLAIVKHIVARHRGRLVIESRPGEGATFTVRLDQAG
jgi:two-component system phosphate regulon sensor histidine kinase PhoR